MHRRSRRAFPFPEATRQAARLHAHSVRTPSRGPGSSSHTPSRNRNRGRSPWRSIRKGKIHQNLSPTRNAKTCPDCPQGHSRLLSSREGAKPRAADKKAYLGRRRIGRWLKPTHSDPMDAVFLRSHRREVSHTTHRTAPHCSTIKTASSIAPLP